APRPPWVPRRRRAACVVQVGPSSRTYVPLCDGEHEERDAAAEKSAGNDVREPVDLQVPATPGHADGTEAGERPPPAAARARCGEELDERGTGRAGVGGMARAEGGADGVDESMRAGGATASSHALLVAET